MEDLKSLYTLRGHKKSIYRMAWSQNGNWLASCGADGSVLCHQKNGQSYQSIPMRRDHTFHSNDVSWAPSDSMLVSCSDDGTVIVWKRDIRMPIPPIMIAKEGGELDLYSVPWSPNGDLIAASDQNGTIRFWDAYDRHHTKEILNPEGLRRPVNCIRWRPDNSKQLASASDDGTVILYSLAEKKISRKILFNSPETIVTCLDWSQDSKLLVFSLTRYLEDRNRYEICVIDVDAECIIHQVDAHDNQITSVSFSRSTDLICSKADDGKIKIWNVSAFSLLFQKEESGPTGHFFPGVAFHPSADILATLCEEGTAIQLWCTRDLKLGNQKGELYTKPVGITKNFSKLFFKSNQDVENQYYEKQKKTMHDKISILFLSADPTDASRLRLGQEFRTIGERLNNATMRHRFKLEHPQFSLRPTDITRSLLETKPQIVHFSGHGTSSGGLCFENELGQTHIVQPDALSSLFKLFSKDIECIILNACYSEQQAIAISEHINFVIGMSTTIGDDAAIAFTLGFYQALGAGESIEKAFKFGCVQIKLHGISEHLTLILLSK